MSTLQAAAVPAAPGTDPAGPAAPVPAGCAEELGARIVGWADALAVHSDAADALTVTYLTPAHQACSAQLRAWMQQAGMQAEVDALGNVVGRYGAADPSARTLLTGSHFDTVRNAGRFDGRLGILLPIAVAGWLHARGERLPCHLEVIGFAEEEGVRFKSSFLGSSALAGRFDFSLLDRTDDADGITVREALRAAGLPATPASIQALQRDPARLAGYLEVHIEQGPVLLDRGLPVGVVTSIAGSVRMMATVTGVAGHSGTTPMTMRRDAVAAVAEMVLAIERRCAQVPALVGTVGMLEVPGGATNVVPGRCVFSLDIRAAADPVLDAAVTDVVAACEAIAVRRGVTLQLERTMQVPSVPCAPRLTALLRDCVAAAGRPHGFVPLELPSGAGHDAMMIAHLTDVAMLFVRCGAGGISHNPAETMTAADAGLAAEVFLEFARRLPAA